MTRGILTRPLPLLGVLALVGSSLACGPDGAIDGDDDLGSESESESGEDQDVIGDPALGIDIVQVEANQGTAVAIGQEGEWVGAEGRNAYMIRDRDTLVRVHHRVHEGWVPREIVGILHLQTADGELLEPRVARRVIEADSDPKNLNTQFYFSVVAAEAKPGLRYWVELREGSLTPEVGGASSGIATTPADFGLVGYEETALEMKVVLVPIEYTYIDPPTIAVVTDSDKQIVADALLQTNPVQSVDVQVHEPYLYTQQLTDLGALLSPTSALRASENPDPNVYYHALVDVRGPAVNMVAGIAWLTNDSKNEGNSRVAATVWYKPGEAMNPSGSAEVIVHEIGHNQGLSHVFCPAASSPAAGPDPSYPHMDGKIGVYGFGIRSFRLYTPTAAHDYMTYCGNAWVSDWTWNKTYNRIRTLTSWDYEAGSGADEGPVGTLLVGTLFGDGKEQWWTLRGPIPSLEARSGEQRVDLIGAGGELLDQQYAAISTLSDGVTQMVIVPLDHEIDDIVGIARVDWRGETHETPREAITIGHRDFDVTGLR